MSKRITNSKSKIIDVNKLITNNIIKANVSFSSYTRAKNSNYLSKFHFKSKKLIIIKPI